MAGNKNSGRKQEKPFADALRMELVAAGEDHKALRLVAKKLIELAQDGKMDAINALADRTDGKVPQAVVGDPDNPMHMVHRIERLIIDPASNPNSQDIPTASSSSSV